MTLLSDKRILEEREKGNLVIEPFDEASLGPNSYDVRLGEWFYAPSNRGIPIDITNPDLVRRYWGEPRIPAYGDGRGRFLVVPAGATFLCHTEEVVGGARGIAVEMRARSSIGRSGLSVCKCAGLGDVGYVARWTMELTNHSSATLLIPVGIRIAQMLFHEVGETMRIYRGKYGASKWTPGDMLPKLHLDREVAT